MKYSVKHYNEYITYLLTFDCQIGNSNASLSSLYIMNDDKLIEKAETDLIANLEFEEEDTQFYNPKLLRVDLTTKNSFNFLLFLWSHW